MNDTFTQIQINGVTKEKLDKILTLDNKKLIHLLYRKPGKTYAYLHEPAPMYWETLLKIP